MVLVVRLKNTLESDANHRGYISLCGQSMRLRLAIFEHPFKSAFGEYLVLESQSARYDRE